MAEAIICDLCGNVISNNNQKKPSVGSITPMVYTGDTCTSPKDGRPDYAKTWVDTCKIIDLCDKCVKSFEEWKKIQRSRRK